MYIYIHITPYCMYTIFQKKKQKKKKKTSTKTHYFITNSLMYQGPS